MQLKTILCVFVATLLCGKNEIEFKLNLFLLLLLIYCTLTGINCIKTFLRAMCCWACRERVCAMLYAELQVYGNSHTFHRRRL